MEKLFEELLEGFTGSKEAKATLIEHFTKAFDEAVEASAQEKTDALKEATIKQLEEANEAYKDVLKQASEEVTQKHITEELSPRIERFAVAAASNIHEQFKTQIEESARGEVADQFLASIAESAARYKLSVDPESKKVLEEKDTKIADLSTRLDKSLAESETAVKELQTIKASAIFESVVADLTDTRKEVVKEASSTIAYVNDDQYSKAVTSIKESYFPVEAETTKQAKETVVENKQSITESVDDPLVSYLRKDWAK